MEFKMEITQSEALRLAEVLEEKMSTLELVDSSDVVLLNNLKYYGGLIFQSEKENSNEFQTCTCKCNNT
jgi:hypothetical protein